MKLCIFRHAQSPSLSEAGVLHDSERPISKDGRRAVVRMAQELSKKGLSPEIILTSPLKRTRETSEEISGVFHPKSGIKVFTPLANELSADELYEELKRETADLSSVVIVGHQPQLGELVALLTGQTIDLRPGGTALVELATDQKPALISAQNP